MRKILAYLVALALLATQAAASNLLIDPYKFAAPASITFLQCAQDNGNNSTFTFASQNTGTASADRYTIIAIMGDDSATTFDVTSVTVGGDAATEVADHGASGSMNDTALYILANPAGTSETVAVTFSEAVVHASICLAQVNGLISATPLDTAASFDTAAGAITLSVNTTAGGIAVGMCSTQTNGVSTIWTGLTERADENLSEAGAYSYADLEVVSGATPLSITCDYTGGADTTGVAASFR